MLNTEPAPRSYSHLDADVRAEMLVGHLADMLSPVRALAGAIRLQSNASVVTRGKLEHLLDLTGAVWEELGRIREEVQGLRKDMQVR
jgi:hypothetical protein